MNEKVYIGQTIKTIEKRFREHKADSKNDKDNYIIHKAMRKYGVEHFYVELIEECRYDDLNNKEIYWISQYDSFHNGYNATLGGDGTKVLDIDEELVCKRYDELGTANEVAKEFGCSSSAIQDILRKCNIPIKSAVDHAIEKGRTVFQYDKNRNLVATYSSLGQAGIALAKQANSKRENLYMDIRIAIMSGRLSHGFYWDSDEYTEEYKKSEYEKYMESHKKSDKKRARLGLSKKRKTGICCDCGKLIERTSDRCNECQNKKRKQDSIVKRELNGITREVLKQEIRTMSFLQIGKKYGVTDNAIRKWCKAYGLPYKSSEIKKYTDEEWELI